MRIDEAARELLGVPWRHQGRNPAVGVDCIGLGRYAVERATGLDLSAFDHTDYGTDPAFGILEACLDAAPLDHVALTDIAPGDLVTMDLKGTTRHLGIISRHPLGMLGLIHTGATTKFVAEHILDAKWRRRLRGAYRVR